MINFLNKINYFFLEQKMKKIIKSIYHVFENFGSFIFFEKYFSEKEMRLIRNLAKGCDTILELGAGQNSYYHVDGRKYKITGFDIHEPSLMKAKENGKIDDYIVGNVLEINKIFNEKSYDLVCAFDLIEHLKKEDGYKLIANMKKISRKKIVLYTPNGFLPQPPSKDNPFQEHLSGWDYNEMTELGFNVIGFNGHKVFRGMYAKPKIRPYFLGIFLSNISMWFLRKLNLENYSFSILCYKNI